MSIHHVHPREKFYVQFGEQRRRILIEVHDQFSTVIVEGAELESVQILHERRQATNENYWPKQRKRF